MKRDTVIVAQTADGEIRSRPMPRIQAEMLLVLGVRGGHGRVRSTGLLAARLVPHVPQHVERVPLVEQGA